MEAEHLAEYVVTEHGKQIDCEAQGCDPPHDDNGAVSTWPERHFGPPPLDKPAVLNSHACQWVTRTITYSPWRQIDGSTSDDRPHCAVCGHGGTCTHMSDMETEQNAESVAWNSVKVSYAISHLRAAVTVLRQQGLAEEADEVSRLADRIEVIQVQLNDGGDA